MEVLQLIAEGKANKETASELGIGIKTVEKHREHLMEKLDIHDTAGLTRYAISAGIIEQITDAEAPLELEPARVGPRDRDRVGTDVDPGDIQIGTLVLERERDSATPGPHVQYRGPARQLPVALGIASGEVP